MTKLIGLGFAVVFAATTGFAATPKDAGASPQPAVKQQPASPAPLRIAPYTKTNSKRA